MNPTLEVTLEEALERARVRFEKEGYRVHVKPTGADVPAFLEGYIPDIVARKGDEGVIVGVKPVPPTEADNVRAAYFAREVAKHPGWRFDLYLARPRQEILDAPLQPSRQELAAELATARKIAEEEGPRAALVYAWGLLESVARLLVLNERRGEAKRYKPASIVGMLVSEGYVEDDLGEELYGIAASRNLIAHGFTKVNVSEEQINKLLNTVSMLLSKLRVDAG